MVGCCETSIEEWQRRVLRSIKSGLGIQEATWPPQHRGYKLGSTEVDGLADLVAKMPERPPITTPPVRRLSEAEVARLYGKGMLSPRYDKAKES